MSERKKNTVTLYEKYCAVCKGFLPGAFPYGQSCGCEDANPPASSTPSEQDERDFQAYRKSPEYRIGEIPAFLAGRAGMVPASESLSWSLHKEICDGAIAEAEKAATMRERERCRLIVKEHFSEWHVAHEEILNPPQESDVGTNASESSMGGVEG